MTTFDVAKFLLKSVAILFGIVFLLGNHNTTTKSKRKLFIFAAAAALIIYLLQLVSEASVKSSRNNERLYHRECSL